MSRYGPMAPPSNVRGWALCVVAAAASGAGGWGVDSGPKAGLYVRRGRVIWSCRELIDVAKEADVAALYGGV